MSRLNNVFRMKKLGAMERSKPCFCEGEQYTPEAMEDASLIMGGARRARLAYHREAVGYRGSIAHELKKVGKRYNEKRAQRELSGEVAEPAAERSKNVISELGNKLLMNFLTIEDVKDRR